MPVSRSLNPDATETVFSRGQQYVVTASTIDHEGDELLAIRKPHGRKQWAAIRDPNDPTRCHITCSLGF